MLAFTQKSFGKQNEFFILNTHAVVEHATVLVLFFLRLQRIFETYTRQWCAEP